MAVTRALDSADTLDVGLTVRFTIGERETIDEIAAERTRAMRHSGGKVTAGDVVRGAVRREIDGRNRKARSPR